MKKLRVQADRQCRVRARRSEIFFAVDRATSFSAITDSLSGMVEPDTSRDVEMSDEIAMDVSERNDKIFLEDIDGDIYDFAEVDEELPTEEEIMHVEENACRLVVAPVVASVDNNSMSIVPSGEGNSSGVTMAVVQSAEGSSTGRKAAPGLRDVPDPHLVKAGNAEERTKSDRNNTWALRRANFLREQLGWDMSIEFGHLPLQRIDELLSELFTRVTKVDGSDYPSSSLANMCNSFNRLIRRASAYRSVHGGGNLVEKDFQIKYHPAFAKTRLVLDAAIKKSAKDGNNKKRKKVEFLTEKMEHAIFSDVEHQITDSVGCQKRFAAMFMIQCGIRGGVELWDMERQDVQVLVDSKGREYVRFEERHSKNNEWGLDRYNEENFRETYHSYDPEFVLCTKQYLRHMPPYEEGVTSKFLFLGPILHPFGIIWFNRVTKVGKDTCANYLKNMLKLVGLPVDLFTNKSARTTLITRMCAKGVPEDVGRRVTGHHTNSGYRRYDRTQDLQLKAAVMVSATPGLSYEQALTDVSKEFVHDKLVGSDSNLRPLLANCTGNSPTLAISSLHASTSTETVVSGPLVSGPSVSTTVQQASVSVEEDVELNSKGKEVVQADKWQKLFGPIDWDAVIAKDPILAKHLGGTTAVSNTGQMGIAPGCNFANCQVTVIINQKDKEAEKENMAPK